MLLDSKASSKASRCSGVVRRRLSVSVLRMVSSDDGVVDVIGRSLRHLRFLQQEVLRGTLTDEICQLQKEDIQIIDNVPCFNINASGGKHLKTASSDRIVPVHPDLLALGLLYYVDSIKAGQLWKNLEPDQYGRWGHKFGKWYGLFNRKEITNNQKKCFHSFRHTVANQLKQKGINEALIAQIIGHKNESITTGRYGKSYEIGILFDALSALSY